MTRTRALAALALLVALAHLPFLATSLEDIDSVNFAVGVRDFDVADHRPHPPGYPVYIGLGKVMAAVGDAVELARLRDTQELRSTLITERREGELTRRRVSYLGGGSYGGA